MEQQRLTLVMSRPPYSVYVRMPTSAKVVWDEKMRSPQPWVVCKAARGEFLLRHAHNGLKMPALQDGC